MAIKRERKPRKPKIEEPEQIFAGIIGNPLEKVIPVNEPEEVSGTLEDAVNDLLGVPTAVDRVVGVDTIQQKPVTDIDQDGVDEYIRRQVLTEMYGTDSPSDYDIISLAIKRRL